MLSGKGCGRKKRRRKGGSAGGNNKLQHFQRKKKKKKKEKKNRANSNVSLRLNTLKTHPFLHTESYG